MVDGYVERIELLSPEFMADPYPTYRTLREQAPVFHSAYGFWVVTRYHDVLPLLDDPRFTRALRCWKTFEPIVAAMADTPLKRDFFTSMSQLDPPEHTELKRAVHHGFTAAAAARSRDDVQELTDLAIDRLIDEGGGDLHAVLSMYVPIRVLARMFGVPRSEEDRFALLATELRNATRMTATTQERVAGMNAVTTMEELIASVLDHGHGFLASLRELLDDDTLQTLVRTLIIAGAEPPAYLADLAVMTLCEHPEAQRLLRESPELLGDAIAEIMRLNHIGRFVQRLPREDVRIGDTLIPAGEMIFAGIASAHRDPEVFDEPDRFDIHRRTSASFPFGRGRFACLAQHLARLQGEVMIGTILRRLPNLQCQRIEWDMNIYLRSMKKLEVTV